MLKKLPLAVFIEPDILGNTEKRLDPFYYCNLKFPPYIKSKLALLGEMCNVNPKRKIEGLRDDALVPYIGLPDTDEHTGAVVNIERRPYKQVRGRNIVSENDILFARIEPSIYNQKYIYVDRLPEKQKYAFTSTEFHVLEPKEGINPKYIFWIIRTDYVYNQVFGKVRGTTGRRRLDKRELEEFKLPFPPHEKRQQIVRIMEIAYKEKIEKLKRSRELIEGINNFVLGKLDMELPRTEEDRTTRVNLDTDLESRFDVAYYRPKYLTLLNSIESSPYDVKLLKEMSKSIVSGQRPKGGVKYIKDGIPSIGGEHITSEADFNFENIRFISKEFHEKQKKSWIKPFDILIVKDGATTGKVAIIPKSFYFQDCNINEHVFKIEVKKENNPYYIFSYLFSSLGQAQITRLISGATQKGITRDAIEKVKIIAPTTAVQNRIAGEVKKRIEECRTLKKEAEKVVEKAKGRVEKIIGGKSLPE